MREHPAASTENGPGEAVRTGIWLLNDPLRLAVLAVLGLGKSSVGDLTARVGWVQSQVSDSLAYYKAAGWVSCQKVGRETIYQLTGSLRVRFEGPHLVIELDADRGDSIRIVLSYELGRKGRDGLASAPSDALAPRCEPG